MKFTPDTVHICVTEGNTNVNWIDTFNFLENHTRVAGSIQIDFTDPINEYIPTLKEMVNTKEEYCFQHLAEEHGKVKCKNNNLLCYFLPSTYFSFVIYLKSTLVKF